MQIYVRLGSIRASVAWRISGEKSRSLAAAGVSRTRIIASCNFVGKHGTSAVLLVYLGIIEKHDTLSTQPSAKLSNIACEAVQPLSARQRRRREVSALRQPVQAARRTGCISARRVSTKRTPPEQLGVRCKMSQPRTY
jgi:hypothetical protein